jgi:hypothetical protein
MINCKLSERPFKSVINDIYFENIPGRFGQSPRVRKLDYEFTSNEDGSEAFIDVVECELFDKIKIELERGQFHALEKPEDFYKGYEVHLHSDIVFLNKHIHIDYYGYAHYGPGSALQEILLFDDAGLIKRGGGGHAHIVRFYNNWPLLFKVDNFYLCFDEFPEHPLGNQYHINVYHKKK